jgi:hypothetical protein
MHSQPKDSAPQCPNGPGSSGTPDGCHDATFTLGSHLAFKTSAADPTQQGDSKDSVPTEPVITPQEGEEALESHEVIELQLFSERKAWIEEKIKAYYFITCMSLH